MPDNRTATRTAGRCELCLPREVPVPDSADTGNRNFDDHGHGARQLHGGTHGHQVVLASKPSPMRLAADNGGEPDRGVCY